MVRKATIGEFEYLVLLSVLRLTKDAHAQEIRGFLRDQAARSISRGALYATLDRLERKGFLTWQVEGATPERGGVPRRRFELTDSGLEAVREAHRVILNVSEGLEGVLEP